MLRRSRPAPPAQRDRGSGEPGAACRSRTDDLSLTRRVAVCAVQTPYICWDMEVSDQAKVAQATAARGHDHVGCRVPLPGRMVIGSALKATDLSPAGCVRNHVPT